MTYTHLTTNELVRKVSNMSTNYKKELEETQLSISKLSSHLYDIEDERRRLQKLSTDFDGVNDESFHDLAYLETLNLPLSSQENIIEVKALFSTYYYSLKNDIDDKLKVLKKEEERVEEELIYLKKQRYHFQEIENKERIIGLKEGR